MRLVITSELRFLRSPDGKVWTETVFPFSYWQRYLKRYDQVLVVARVKEVSIIQPEWKRADGENVFFLALPHYVGPLGFLRSRQQIFNAAKSGIKYADAVILSVPSPIAMIVERVVRKSGGTYAVEVKGDPWDVFSPGAHRHPLRLIFRYLLTWAQKRQVRGAIATSYVTRKALQKRYPARKDAFAVGVSDIELSPAHVVKNPRVFDRAGTHVVSLGSLETLYKGADLLLQALAENMKAGGTIQMTWIGGGQFLPHLKGLAQKLGLENRVQFLGQLSCGNLIRETLDKADLFIFPSRQEGLPRALVEAMARGLPCIGSAVGGIPELLEPNELFPREDWKALQKKFEDVLSQPDLLTKMSHRNLAKSREFLDVCLEAPRMQFLDYILTTVNRTT